MLGHAKCSAIGKQKFLPRLDGERRDNIAVFGQSKIVAIELFSFRAAIVF